MPELVEYTVEVETRVIVRASGSAGGGVVGEFVVRARPPRGCLSDRPDAIPGLVEQAMTKNTKQAKVMAAGVDNMERNRLR